MIVHEYSAMYGKGIVDKKIYTFSGNGGLIQEEQAALLAKLLCGTRDITKQVIEKLSYTYIEFTNDTNDIDLHVLQEDILHLVVKDSRTIEEATNSNAKILWYDIQDNANVTISVSPSDGACIRLITCSKRAQVHVLNLVADAAPSDTIVHLIGEESLAKVTTRSRITNQYSLIEQIHFVGAHTNGSLNWKGVLDGGIIHYRPLLAFEQGSIESRGTQHADLVKTRNKGLVNIVPEVSASHKAISSSHGVSIHPVPKEHVEYLLSKGMAKEEIDTTLESVHLSYEI